MTTDEIRRQRRDCWIFGPLTTYFALDATRLAVTQTGWWWIVAGVLWVLAIGYAARIEQLNDMIKLKDPKR